MTLSIFPISPKKGEPWSSSSRESTIFQDCQGIEMFTCLQRLVRIFRPMWLQGRDIEEVNESVSSIKVSSTGFSFP